MGKGRKPTPTLIKIARGVEKRYINRAEPGYSPPNLTPPAYLQGEALEFWQEMAEMLSKSGTITEADRHSLALLCTAFAAWRRLPSDYNISEYRRQLCEFGLTPASRSKVKAEKAPVDHLDEFLARKAK